MHPPRCRHKLKKRSDLSKSLIFLGLHARFGDWVGAVGMGIPAYWDAESAKDEGGNLVATAPRTKRNAVKPAQIAKAIDEGRESLDLYLDEISRVPLLSREEEMELARKAFRGNVAAQERLARHNVRFVVSVAKKFQNRGGPLVDLIGQGNPRPMTARRSLSRRHPAV